MNTMPENILALFKHAESENRTLLFEHEVYQIMEALDIPTPTYAFIPSNPPSDLLSRFSSSKIVLKVVSPYILHKTDVKGIRIIEADDALVKQHIQAMREDVPHHFVTWVQENPALLPDAFAQLDITRESDRKILQQQIKESIQGILVCEAIPFEQFGLGSEVMIGMNQSREFGSVVTFGPGGTMVEYLNERMEPGTATVIFSAHTMDPEAIQAKLEGSLAYDILTGKARGMKERIPPHQLINTIAAIQRFVATYSAVNQDAAYVIEEFEVNPFVTYKGNLTPLDGLCRFSKSIPKEAKKPIHKIKHLLEPKSAGIIGVSEKMNVGHIILKNLVDFGFDPNRIYIVKPNSDPIDGCRCVDSVEALPEKVDMFVVTVSADQTPEVVEDLVNHDQAQSVILIAGGVGEKEGSEVLEQRLKDAIATSRNQPDGGIVFNGGNCLGIYSYPGKYNTIFIPEYKLPMITEGTRRIAYLSQSGAFMITRLSNLTSLAPRYSVSTGNQIDLSVTDFLSYLKNDPEIKVFAVYVEGFGDLDGIHFANVAREIIQSGRMVVLYKSGRSEEGKTAASGHTASIAGSFDVCDAIMKDAGILMSYNFQEFEQLITSLHLLEQKTFAGNRVGLISNAGFECVGMADNLSEGSSKLKLAEFSSFTAKKLASAFEAARIDQIVDVHNPLDITPMASDEIYTACTQALLEDNGVDAVVVSCVPLTAMMQTLPPSTDGSHKENFMAPEAFVPRMIQLAQQSTKPFVVAIDSGKLYDPMADALLAGGIPVFRKCDQAVQILRRVIEHRNF